MRQILKLAFLASLLLVSAFADDSTTEKAIEEKSSGTEENVETTVDSKVGCNTLNEIHLTILYTKRNIV